MLPLYGRPPASESGRSPIFLSSVRGRGGGQSVGRPRPTRCAWRTAPPRCEPTRRASCRCAQVGRHGLAGDAERLGDLGVGAASGQQDDDLDLAGVSPPGRPARRRTRWPAAASTALTASPSRRPSRTSSAASLGRGRRRRPAGAAGARERVVHVGRREDRAPGDGVAVSPWDSRPSSRSWCSAAHSRSRPASACGPASARSGRGGAGPLALAEDHGSGSVPDGAGHADHADSWSQPARRAFVTSSLGHAGGARPRRPGRRRPGCAVRGRGLEVGEVAERVQRGVDRASSSVAQPGSRAMTSSQAGSSPTPSRIVAAGRGRSRPGRDRTACPGARSATSMAASAPPAWWNASTLSARCTSRIAGASVLAPTSARHAPAVPALEGLQERRRARRSRGRGGRRSAGRPAVRLHQLLHRPAGGGDEATDHPDPPQAGPPRPRCRATNARRPSASGRRRGCRRRGLSSSPKSSASSLVSAAQPTQVSSDV